MTSSSNRSNSGVSFVTERQYSYKELIEAYIATQRTYVHDDFTNFYKQLSATLQDLFDIHFLSRDQMRELPSDIRKGGILMVFNATAGSFLAIRTPWSGFLEGGLGIATLDDMYGQPFLDLAEQSRTAHYTLLDTLFKMMYGDVERIVTSEELRLAGFDDAKEPKISDYWDYV